jgi:hypothetical protein
MDRIDSRDSVRVFSRSIATDGTYVVADLCARAVRPITRRLSSSHVVEI